MNTQRLGEYKSHLLNNNLTKKNLLLIGLPIITFFIGLMLPSPLHRSMFDGITDSQPSDIVQVDTILPDGSHYEGGMLDGKRMGEGILTYADGNIYEGKWKSDLLHYGIRRTSHSIYHGRFDKELRNHGFGIIEYTDEFIKGKQEPMANVIKTYSGMWEHDSKEGLGRAIMADGSMRFGKFKEGVYKPVEGQNFSHGKDLVYGIDVSHYQDDIDWDKLAVPCDKEGKVNGVPSEDKKYLQPVLFAIIKATEGSSVQDEKYSIRMEEARRHGLIRGSYHLFHCNTPVQSQVENFLDIAKWKKGDLPPILDVEFENEVLSCGKETAQKNILEWLKSVENVLNIRPIIYTSDSFRSKYLNDPRFTDYKFWIARYGTAPVSSSWLFWQFTENGQIEGYNGKIDINIGEMSYDELLRYVNTSN